MSHRTTISPGRRRAVSRARIAARGVLVIFLLWVGTARAGMQPEAAGILKKMFGAYAQAAAFACDGSCEDHEEGSPLPPDHRTMTLRFARPGRIRLAWTQKDFHGRSGTSLIFTREGKTFFRQWGEKQDEPEPSLGQALDSCAGISLGLSYLVPALLLGEPGYLDFVSLQQLADASSEDGRACWKLAGKTSEGVRWELLIDRETCALREATEINVLSGKDHPTVGDSPPPHAIHTRYRFTNIRFADTLPDGEFVEPAPVSTRKKR